MHLMKRRERRMKIARRRMLAAKFSRLLKSETSLPKTAPRLFAQDCFKKELQAATSLNSFCSNVRGYQYHVDYMILRSFGYEIEVLNPKSKCYFISRTEIDKDKRILCISESVQYFPTDEKNGRGFRWNRVKEINLKENHVHEFVEYH